MLVKKYRSLPTRRISFPIDINDPYQLHFSTRGRNPLRFILFLDFLKSIYVKKSYHLSNVKMIAYDCVLTDILTFY